MRRIKACLSHTIADSPIRELKKRIKERQKAELKAATQAKKAEEAASQPKKAAAGPSAAAKEAEMDAVVSKLAVKLLLSSLLQAFYELRSNTINKLRQTKNPNPYPHKFNVSQSIPRYIAEWGAEGKIEKGASLSDAKPVSWLCIPVGTSLPLTTGVLGWSCDVYSRVWGKDQVLRCSCGWRQGTDPCTGAVSLPSWP